MPIQIRLLRRLILPLGLVALSGAVVAQSTTGAPADDKAQREQQLNLTLTAGGIWSDNIGRAATNEQSGTIGILGARLGYEQQTRRIETDVDLNTAFEHYFDNTFDDGVLGGVNARLNVGLVPDHFLWNFRENFGQITTDPFSASSPNNRENVNLFTTGPDFFLNFGDATVFKLSARHSAVNYETQNLDGTQNEGDLTLTRQLSGKSAVSLIGQAGRYEFDDQVANTDYDRYEELVRYEAQGARTSLKADAGYTSIDRKGDTSSGALARLSLTRKTSPGGTFSLSAGTEFSSAGDIFRLGQEGGGVQLQSANIIGTSDPFKRNYGSVGFDFNRHRTSAGANVQYSKEKYDTSTALDRSVATYTAYFGRQLSGVLSFRLFGTYEQERFDNIAFEDDELTTGAYLDWALGRRLALRLQLDHFDRNSSNASTAYTENHAAVFLLWSPVQQR